jgi:uroporphyrinogen-III synthase
MSSGQVLSGLRVLNTRPAHQAAGLTALLSAAGASVRELPLLAIVPTPRPQLAQQALAQEIDAAIVTSANAARAAAQFGLRWPRWVFALGPGTAAALSVSGVVATALAGSDSEALLGLPELQAVAGQRLLLVTGEGGREVLASRLRKQATALHIARVYARAPVPHAPEQLAAALAWANLIVLTSAEAMHCLHGQCDAANAKRWAELPLLLPSARVSERAQQLGHQARRWLPKAVNDQALVDCLMAKWAG